MSLNSQDLARLRRKLEKEQSRLRTGLSRIARMNPGKTGDWKAVPAETSEVTFRDEVADRLEELQDREATVKPLKIRLGNVTEALERIKNQNYGLCSVCQQPIEPDRLEANPAAGTCKQHMETPHAG